ncbi:MAG: NADH-quinone oxidoreductase subunit C [Vicinamibacterales bacterium]
MDTADIIQALTTALPGAAYEAGASVDFPALYVPADRLVETCRTLRDDSAFRFNVLIELTAADYLPRAPRFEVVYHLLSVSYKRRLRLKVRVAADATVPTVQSVWPAAGWPEREVYDMFGIVFEGHEDLRRILMPDDWEGHPQRKDYPVQIRKAAQTYEPLQISEDEFRANLERDRVKRVPR